MIDWELHMVQLVVRNLSDELVKALKQRAAKHNRSAEQSTARFWKQRCAGRSVEALRRYSRLCRTWEETRTSSANNQTRAADNVLG
jgi:plasmid stability protein